jgi:uncharacterized damage-inducible protein DinB
MAKRTSSIQLLLHALDEAYGVSAWHGTNLRGSLRGVSARAASWRPGTGRHSIRELVLHAAYWKYRVRQRLTGDGRLSFAIAGKNFFRLPDPTEKRWRFERQLLDREHRALRRAVASFPETRLRKPLPRSRRRTALREIAGITLHDVYHTGQIQMLKVLYRQRRKR